VGYDGRGNLTSSGASSYSYNKLNELLSAPGTAMQYDPLGRLQSYTAGVTTRFQSAGGMLAAERDTAGTLLRRVACPGEGRGAGAGQRRGGGVGRGRAELD
jgi:hypothetical protein